MKISVALLVLVIGMGIGFAAGKFLVPAIWSSPALQATPASSSPSDEGTTTASASGEAAPTTATTKLLPAPGSVDLNTVLNETNAYRAVKELSQFADSISPQDIPAVFQKILSSPTSPNQSQLLSILAARWVTVDPKAAVAEAEKPHNDQTNQMLVSAVFGALAGSDPDGAVAQVQQIPLGENRNEAGRAVVSQIAQQDPARAVAISQQLKTGGPNGYIDFSGIFSQWANKDLGQATQAALQLPTDQQRSNAIMGIISGLSDKDPQAVQALVNQLPAGPMRNQAQQNVVNQMASKDPKTAVDYLATLPDSQKETPVWS
jgi:folylpolyglutamate synthase/dihydropteroate synthase